MMSYHSCLTTREALASTIDTDGQVYRWFTHLVTQPAVRKRLTEEKGCPEIYQQLGVLLAAQNIAYLLLIILCGWFAGKGFSSWGWVGLLSLLPLYYLHLEKRRAVNQLSMKLIDLDFPPALLTQKTLYQIGEFYGLKYNIPTLVDVIFSLDNIARNTVIFAVIFLTFIHPLQIRIWNLILLVIIFYYLVFALVNTSFIYKRLR